MNTECSKILVMGFKRFLGVRHGEYLNTRKNCQNLPSEVLSIACLMSFDVDVHQLDDFSWLVNGPVSIGKNHSSTRITEYKKAILDPCDESISPTNYYHLMNSYCWVRRTDEGLYTNHANKSTMEIPFHCNCWLANHCGICPAIAIVAEEKNVLNPRLEQLFESLFHQKITVDPTTNEVSTFSQPKKRTKLSCKTYYKYFGIQEGKEAPVQFRFLQTRKPKQLQDTLMKTSTKVPDELVMDSFGNKNTVTDSHWIASFLIGTALGDTLSVLVDPNENPVWLKLHNEARCTESRIIGDTELMRCVMSHNVDIDEKVIDIPR